MGCTQKKEENIQRATMIVMLTLLLSRLLGFVREVIVANVYGASVETDAFFAAFTIPDVMFNLLIAGALSSGFMPVFTSYLAKGEEENAWKSANSFITVSLIFILVFNVFGMMFAKYLVPIIAPGMIKVPGGFDLTVKLTQIMFTAVTFTVLAGLLRGILNSYKIFTAPAIGPVLYNVGMILGAMILGATSLGIYGMTIGVILGAFLNFIVQIPDFRRVGGNKYLKLTIDFKDPGFKRMVVLMIPAIIGLSVSQLNIVINQSIASLVGDGFISLVRYANRVMLLPLGIFAMGIATTLFPVMNTQIARNEIQDFKKTFSEGFRTIMYITIPAAAGMIVLSEPVIRLLFKSGSFTESDVQITGGILACYSIGLIGQSGVQIITRGFYAIQDTKTPVKVAFITVVLNAALCVGLTFYTPLSIAGVSMAYSISSIVNMYLLYRGLSRKTKGLRTKEISQSFIKASIASFIMGGAALIVSRVAESFVGHEGKTEQIIGVGLSMLVAIPLYFFVTYKMRMSEMDFFLAKVKRKLKK
ncbi:MAG: murein biosynthesis integral membrane protein MurJ [Clostridium sp.]|uniref:murein biosynthesis integral membrane protein MurJ n=1 Tax=Clostridium sp. TaxID=1506 RepID=UPI002FCCB835